MKTFRKFSPRQLQIMDLLQRVYPMPMHADCISAELNLTVRAPKLLFEMAQAHRVVKCANAIYGSAGQ